MQALFYKFGSPMNDPNSSLLFPSPIVRHLVRAAYCRPIYSAFLAFSTFQRRASTASSLPKDPPMPSHRFVAGVVHGGHHVLTSGHSRLDKSLETHCQHSNIFATC